MVGRVGHSFGSGWAGPDSVDTGAFRGATRLIMSSPFLIYLSSTLPCVHSVPPFIRKLLGALSTPSITMVVASNLEVFSFH